VPRIGYRLGHRPLLAKSGTSYAFTMIPVLELRDVEVGGLARVRARLAAVSLAVNPGKCVGVVGPSGAGKSTLCQVAVGLLRPDAGAVDRRGEPVTHLDPLERHHRGHRTALLEQDPFGSLDPRAPIAASIAEPLGVFRRVPAAVMARVHRVLATVGLPADLADRRPTTLSGGEAQRVALARALISEPDLLVLDEPTSALDAVNRARLANVLLDVLETGRTGVLLVSHDAAFVRHLADRILVLDQGRIVREYTPAEWPAGPPTAGSGAATAEGSGILGR